MDKDTYSSIIDEALIAIGNNKLNFLTEAIDDTYVVVLDSKTNVIAVNSRLEKLCGCSYIGKFLGEYVGCLYAENDNGGCGQSSFCSECGFRASIIHIIEGGEWCETDANLSFTQNKYVVTKRFDLLSIPIGINGKRYPVLMFQEQI